MIPQYAALVSGAMRASNYSHVDGGMMLLRTATRFLLPQIFHNFGTNLGPKERQTIGF